MDLADLGALGASEPADLSVLTTGAPLVLTDTRRPPPEGQDLARAVACLRTMPTVTVLVGRPGALPAVLVDAVDVCLTDAPDPPAPWVTGEPSAIVAAVEAQPTAALATMAVLRITGGQPTWDAVATEAAAYGALLGSSGFATWLAERRRPARRRGGSRPPVNVHRHGAVLSITLDRPEARNAVDSALRDSLVAALAVAEHDPSITRVVLSGRGPAFCAGGDLDEFGTVADPAIALAVRLTTHPGLAVDRMADRTSVRLHGWCIGAGIEIPAFARHVVAVLDTTIALPELAMGLMPGAGGTVSLPRRIGRARTAWLALTGTAIDATTAQTWGLVDEVEAP